MFILSRRLNKGPADLHVYLCGDAACHISVRRVEDLSLQERPEGFPEQTQTGSALQRFRQGLTEGTCRDRRVHAHE